MRVDGLNPTPVVNTVTNTKKPVIHNVIISDASGSMGGSKYRASCEGIKSELKILKEDSNVDYLLTFVEFASAGFSTTTEHAFTVPVKDVNVMHFRGSGGGTPLYNVVGQLLKRIQDVVKPDERVLIKVFTDGEDTSYGQGDFPAPIFSAYIKNLIDVSKWTVTFNCTEQDKPRLVRIGIPESNILTHNNTAEDIERVSVLRNFATQSYAKSVAGGASADMLVSSFYSKSVNQ